MSLPIINNISFSSLTDFKLCPKYYNLVHIKRLKPFTNTFDTVFGSVIHAQVQNILLKKVTTEQSVKYFSRLWNKFCKLYKAEQKFIDLEKSGVKIIETLETSLREALGNYEVLQVEYRLQQSLKDLFPQTFKGFIDIIFKLENGKILISDFKTTDSSFWFMKNKDAGKDYQLILYKHFFCLDMSIDIKDAEVSFILLEKNKNSKNPVKVVKVGSTKKKIENCLKWMNSALSAINRQKFIPNRTACFKYGEKHACVFYDTEHCPKSY